MAKDGTAEFRRENDSMHMLPMRIVPIETAILRRGRMIKNSSLAPAIEIFRDARTGSGQIMIDDLDPKRCHKLFGWPANDEHPDLKILRTLGRLASYDVYSLRIYFRELGIRVSSMKYLTLSAEKQEDLDFYMHIFTTPLINLVYGESSNAAERVRNVVDLFRNPDIALARRNLERFARQLEVDMAEIPKFLDDFADVYMSLAYYQDYHDRLMPRIMDLVSELDDMERNWQIRQQHGVMESLRQVHGCLSDLTSSMNGRFDVFRRETERMWDNIGPESFQRVRDLVTSSHVSTGGVLCGLGVKVNAWRRRFPHRDAGGPLARAEALYADILPGMRELLLLERQGRRIAEAA